MTWLTWRQFRIPVVSVYAALVAVGVVLAITGPGLVGRTNYSDLDVAFTATSFMVYLLPALIGVFWGVPMVTRELEHGTHSLVWNQTVTRSRWLATKLGIGAVAAMAATGLLSLAVSWWASPIDATASQGTDTILARVAPVVFAARGIAPIGYAAFAFVLGIAVGILLRRTVAAMAVTLVVFAAVQVAVPMFVRPYLLPAAEDTVAITDTNIRQIVGDGSGVIQSISVANPAGAWVLANETVDPSGNVVTPLPDFVQDCVPTPSETAPPDFGVVSRCMALLGENGYQQHLTYHPGSRFWPLQLIETGLFLALSGLLSWFCFRRLRHLC